MVIGAENKCSATHCFHSSKFLLWCYFLSSFRDQLFFILSQNICEAHAACAQEGQTEVRDITITGSCAWILKNWLKYELQQIFALVITLWQESIAISFDFDILFADPICWWSCWSSFCCHCSQRWLFIWARWVTN